MGIRESLLNTITSVADSDFVRIVTSAGASSKATVRNLFKGFESNLSAKSSLTTSDYIRVVGSDNEAYKQSVSAVKTAMGIDDMNSKFAIRVQTVTVSNITISANGGKTGEVTIPTITGYKPIGLIGWECNTWEVAPSKLTTLVNGAKVWFSLANASTSSKTVNFTMTILYIPTAWATS